MSDHFIRPDNDVHDSCGCVFCDIGFDPDVLVDGVKFHSDSRRGLILCERRPAIPATPE
jgi:hypothetical protein